jgi:hypothetical protein
MLLAADCERRLLLLPAVVLGSPALVLPLLLLLAQVWAAAQLARAGCPLLSRKVSTKASSG